MPWSISDEPDPDAGPPRLSGDRDQPTCRLHQRVVAGLVAAAAPRARRRRRSSTRAAGCGRAASRGSRPRSSARPGRRLCRKTSASSASRSSAVTAARVAERERERALAGVRREEHRSLAVPERRPPGAAVVAGVGPLDLDHVGAERGEDLGAVRPGDRGGDVEHANAVERGERHRSASSPFTVSARMQPCSSRWSTGSRVPTGATSSSSPLRCSTRSSRSCRARSMVIVAGALAGAGDLNVALVILAAWTGARRRRQHLVRDRQVGRRAHGEAAVPPREGPPGLRLGRAAARATWQLHHPRSPASSRSDGRRSRSRPATRAGCRGIASSATTSSPAVLWATYATMLGYIGGKQFEEQPWKGVMLGLGIAFTIAFAVEWIRKPAGRRDRLEAP